MKDNSDISRLVSGDVTLDEVLEGLMQHPAYILPALVLLKHHNSELDAETRRHLQTQIVLNCSDRRALTDYIDPAEADWAHFYPAEAEMQLSTEDTIDDFLNTFGAPSSPEEDRLLERLLFNPVPADYFAGTDDPFDPSDPLALPPELLPHDDEDDAPAETAAAAPVAPTPPAAPAKTSDDTLLTESLAKIFIKQGRYERAFEIISKLSLNYPEKSVYFADQLRFLQKLIINQQAKNSKAINKS